MDRLQLTASERRQLERQLRKVSDVRLYRRILAVLEYSRGRSSADIARELGMTRQSVYNWVSAYASSNRVSSLRDEARVGRPRIWTEDRQVLLRALMQTSPDQLGSFPVNWTVPLLRDQIEQVTGQRPCEQTIRDALHREGYVWKRPRYRLEPDPDFEKKTLFEKANPALEAADCGHHRG